MISFASDMRVVRRRLCGKATAGQGRGTPVAKLLAICHPGRKVGQLRDIDLTDPPGECGVIGGLSGQVENQQQ